MIPETCPDHIPLKSLCCEFCPTKAQIRTYLTVLLNHLVDFLMLITVFSWLSQNSIFSYCIFNKIR